MIPNDKLSIHDGGIAPLGKYKNQMIFWEIEAILKKYDLELKSRIADIPADALNEILYGSLENLKIPKEVVHTTSDYFISFDGVVKYLQNVMDNDDSVSGQKWADQFLAECTCPECKGQRLNRESLSYKIWDKNISDLANMDLAELKDWCMEVEQHMEPGNNRLRRKS